MPLTNDCFAGASANIPAGSLCALIGRNGSGKSTLLRTLAGLSRPESGNILIADTDPYKTSPVKLAQTIAVVTTERIRVTSLRCRDVVALGRAPFTNWIGRMRQDDIKWVDHALGLVGMTEFADRQLSSLSDGESQRIMLARALAQDTR